MPSMWCQLGQPSHVHAAGLRTSPTLPVRARISSRPNSQGHRARSTSADRAASSCRPKHQHSISSSGNPRHRDELERCRGPLKPPSRVRGGALTRRTAARACCCRRVRRAMSEPEYGPSELRSRLAAWPLPWPQYQPNLGILFPSIAPGCVVLVLLISGA